MSPEPGTPEEDGVKMVSGFWHELRTERGRKTALPPFDERALQACADSLRSRYELDAMPDVVSVRSAYYVGHGVSAEAVRARPVWKVDFGKGMCELWDPNGTQIIDQSRDRDAQCAVPDGEAP